MRHTVFINGVAFRLDSEQPKSHVIVGQRDEEFERPKIIRKKEDGSESIETRVDQMTDDERMIVTKFAVGQTQGRYRVKPLDWAKDEAQAIEKAKAFAAPEWINLEIRKVDLILENA